MKVERGLRDRGKRRVGDEKEYGIKNADNKSISYTCIGYHEIMESIILYIKKSK